VEFFVATGFRLGVVIVTYNSRDVIIACLESLFASDDADALEILVVDNDSTDGTAEVVAQWKLGRIHDRIGAASTDCPQVQADLDKPGLERVQILQSNVNGGYAFGVNLGLRSLFPNDAIGAFWVLNPDCVVPVQTPKMFRRFAMSNSFGLASSRCLYLEDKSIIQTDGGRFSRITGVCHSLNARKSAAKTVLPSDDDLDYVSGANMLVSRDYIHKVGYMTEDYFLYYEEVDWACRRGNLPLRLIHDAEIYHMGGTSIGSGSLNTHPSSLSNYFNHRSRLRFVRRFLKGRYPLALAWSLAKAIQVACKVGLAPAWALTLGAVNASPPKGVRERIPAKALTDHPGE
jgi:GT2 family glycosyltransferase